MKYSLHLYSQILTQYRIKAFLKSLGVHIHLSKRMGNSFQSLVPEFSLLLDFWSLHSLWIPALKEPLPKFLSKIDRLLICSWSFFAPAHHTFIGASPDSGDDYPAFASADGGRSPSSQANYS